MTRGPAAVRSRLGREVEVDREGSPRGQRLREMLDELGPTFVKFGQLLSTRPDIVPPDIVFELQNIVIGPQGVCEEADVTATHLGSWLGVEPTGERLEFRVVIFFPWDRERRLFRGERVYVSGIDLPSGV